MVEHSPLLVQTMPILLILISVTPFAFPQGAPDDSALNAALFTAIRQGSSADVKQLLDQGVSPNAREMVLTKPNVADHSPGNQQTLADTALMVAILADKHDMVELLIARNADVNGKGQAGFTPLIYAMSGGDVLMARLLLDHGASPDQRNDYGDTAMVFAANRGYTALIDLLLHHGADINGGAGWTPLMQAAYNGWSGAAEFLLKNKADPNIRRNGLMTALECALIQGNYHIAKMLSEAGAKGRSKEALQQEREQGERAYKEQQKKAQEKQRDPQRQQAVTQEDQVLLEIVLLDVLAHADEELALSNAHGTQIVLMDITARGPGLLMDGQMNGELDLAQANDVSLEIREDLNQRNQKLHPLRSLQFTSKNVHVSQNISQPSTKCWAQIYLPGYTKAHDQAVVRLWLGPSPHGTAGTYYMIKEPDGWQVKWRHFAFFM